MRRAKAFSKRLVEYLSDRREHPIRNAVNFDSLDETLIAFVPLFGVFAFGDDVCRLCEVGEHPTGLHP